MKYIVLSFLLIAILGCKKKEKEAEYWINLSLDIAQDIRMMSSNYSCTENSSLTIQTISERYDCLQYIIIHSKDIEKFDKLKIKYENYVENSRKAGGVPVTLQSCPATDVKREIICQENKPIISYIK